MMVMRFIIIIVSLLIFKININRCRQHDRHNINYTIITDNIILTFIDYCDIIINFVVAEIISLSSLETSQVFLLVFL